MRSIAALLVCAALLLGGAGEVRAERRPPLIVTTLPFDDAKQQEAVFSFLSRHLSASLGVPTRFEASKSYEEVIERLTAGRADVAFLGAMSYLEARRRGHVRAVLRAIRHASSEYRGVIIVPKASTAKSLAELKGTRFAFVDRRSTAGYLLPMSALVKAGLSERDLQASFAGQHTAVVARVAKGEVDAGACFEDAPKNLEDPSVVRVLAYTEPTPGDPVVVRAGLGSELVRRLRSALIELPTLPLARPFFEFAEIDGFVPATDADYDAMAALAKELPAP